MSWFCPECETENPDDVQVCEVCGFRVVDKNEELLWKNVCAKDTIIMYEAYLVQYPLGLYVTKAKNRIKNLNAKDRYDWLAAEKSGTIDSYTKYLHDFPSGVHVTDAKDRIETIYWNNAKEGDTVELYQSYLKHYPYGTYANSAKNRINHIEEELWFWNYAVKGNKISIYNLYLKKYPNDKHKNEADKRIKLLTERLKRRKRARRVLVSVLCCGLLMLFLFIGYQFLPNKASSNLNNPEETNQPFDVSELEKSTEKLIVAMETTKRLGYAVDDNSRKKAEELLRELKGMNSARYNELNRRYNNL